MPSSWWKLFPIHWFPVRIRVYLYICVFPAVVEAKKTADMDDLDAYMISIKSGCLNATGKSLTIIRLISLVRLPSDFRVSSRYINANGIQHYDN